MPSFRRLALDADGRVQHPRDFSDDLLGFRAKQRLGFGPLALGLAAAAAVLVGKFMLDTESTLYAGLGVLVGTSLWNAWPRPQAERHRL